MASSCKISESRPSLSASESKTQFLEVDQSAPSDRAAALIEPGFRLRPMTQKELLRIIFFRKAGTASDARLMVCPTPTMEAPIRNLQ